MWINDTPIVAQMQLMTKVNQSGGVSRSYGERVPFALLLTIVLSALAVFQLALIGGAPLGRYAWGGQHRALPPRLRIGSAVSIVVYALIALIAWDRVGAIDVFPALFSQIAMWVIFGYFTLGILMNAISRSKPERYTMVPVSLLLAVLSLLIALGYGELATAA
jgi:hypothetical protein